MTRSNAQRHQHGHRIDYLDYWSLPVCPFLHHDPSRYFWSDSHRSAINGISQSISNGKQVVVLVSPTGCGATSVLSSIANSAGIGDCAIESVVTTGNQTNKAQVYRNLAEAMRLPRFSGATDLAVRKAVGKSSAKQIRTVWLIDHCRPEVAALAHAFATTSPWVSVVLAVSPAIIRPLAERLCRNVTTIGLASLSIDEAPRYVEHALKMAGASNRILTDSAILELCRLTSGRIRDMAVVAEHALKVAADGDCERVKSSIIRSSMVMLQRAA